MARELAKRGGGGGMMPGPRFLPSFFREEMDRMGRLFDDFFGREEMMPMGWAPPLDITETENKIMVRAELPGVDAEGLDISVSEDTLTIKGEKKEDKEEKAENYYCCERSYGQFSRSVKLPEHVDQEKMDATYHNGVLKIEMNKLPEAKRKKVAIRVQ